MGTQYVQKNYLPAIRKAFSGDPDITSFIPMKLGMTNDSFIFERRDGTFMLRLPGRGSEALIDRKQEYEVYQLLAGRGIADEVLYFDPESGIKITRYIEGARVCDPNSKSDLKECMRVLRSFHDLNLHVDHYFDPWERLEYYESLRGDTPSRYDDYFQIKATIRNVYEWTLNQPRHIMLAHIDPVADNFLFTPDGEVYLIDWEYAAMQDKDIDVAMFAVYSLLDKEQVDLLISLYQDGAEDILQKKKIYAYIAIAGLVWSNWAEFKMNNGDVLGEYAPGQYRFAKDYSSYFYAF
ncbi:MAG TPA: phosphotransferase family protein [Clostridiaceae bacterium]|nr:phosphotransferase family protein [Clostridiaceae bacterium]